MRRTPGCALQRYRLRAAPSERVAESPQRVERGAAVVALAPEHVRPRGRRDLVGHVGVREHQDSVRVLVEGTLDRELVLLGEVGRVLVLDPPVLERVRQDEMRRALNNLNSDLVQKNADYVCRVTADEGDIGRGHLGRFQDVEKPTPVILTTSQLLTTGVDAPTCKNVVLARVVGSMTDFKQIIGRGTRVRDDYGKLWFNIVDYTGSATRLFADPAFDGDPARLLGTPDISSLADLGSAYDVMAAMRIVPIAPRAIAIVTAAASLPMFPLVLMQMPLLEVVKKVGEVVLGGLPG